MKQRGQCLICRKRFTLKKRGMLPGHHYDLGFTIKVCPGSGKKGILGKLVIT